MNIMYLCSTLRQCGPTSQLFNIVSNLDKDVFFPTIVTLSPEPNSTLLYRFQAAGINIISLNLSRFSGFFFANRIVNDLIRELCIDVIHSQGIRADHVANAVIKKNNDIKWVATLRNIPYLDYPKKRGRIIGGWMAFRHISILRECENLVVVSKAIKSELQGYFHKSILAIPNGVDTNHYSEKKTDINVIDLPFSSTDTILVYSGVLEERKNVNWMLDLLAESQGLKLLIVGDGSKRLEIERHPAVVTGKAYLVGSVSDVRPYLVASDAFILLSTAEGLPNSALESLSMGLPLILSDIGPHRDIQNECKDVVHIVDIDDYQSALGFFQSELNPWLSKITRKQCSNAAFTCFSASQNSLLYQDVYRKCS